MSRPRAPTAMRSPISRVRSVTDTSMMFMMPMPPTSSETEAMAASSRVSTFEDASCDCSTSVRLRMLKSSSWKVCSRCRWRSSPRISCSASGMARASRTLTAMEPTERALAWLAAQHLLLGGAERDQDRVVLVLAERGLALALQDADHREGDVLDPDHLAERIAVAEEVAGHGLADERDLGRALDLFLAEQPPLGHVPLARA